MPIYSHRDNKGNYYQWGRHGAKYYFDNNSLFSKVLAKNKAERQARAVYSHGYKGK
jgi:hypothetical protein